MFIINDNRRHRSVNEFENRRSGKMGRLDFWNVLNCVIGGIQSGEMGC